MSGQNTSKTGGHDFLGKRGMEDSLENDNLTDISGMSQSTLISPSEVEVTGDEEYLEDE